MAGNALSRCTHIHAVAVTFFAFKVSMLSFKREGSVVVVKSHIAPTAGGMAGTTVRTELSIVVILVRMTGIAI